MAKDNNGPALPRPLYQCTAPTTFVVKDHNAGLWYDKFVNRWEGAAWSEAKANKLGWIKTVTGPVGSKSLIAEFANRQRQLAERSNGKAFLLTTESRFATGLGREHPIENGFAWHHTLGTPYLPGSSIKGMIRNWAEQWDESIAGRTRDQIKKDVNAVLGGPGCVGRVLVLDALPTSQPELEADVMTPHYGDYYQKGDAPGDWLSPTPIPFLVVAAGTPFQFVIIPKTAADAPHLATVEQWLRDALEWLGAGAKTAVGYGRFNEHVAKVAAPRVPAKIEDITVDQLKQRLAELPTNHVLLKVESKGPGNILVQALRAANIPAGYQADGGWSVDEAPALPSGITIILAERSTPSSKRAKFLNVVGRPSQSPPTNKGQPKNQKGTRR